MYTGRAIPLTEWCIFMFGCHELTTCSYVHCTCTNKILTLDCWKLELLLVASPQETKATRYWTRKNKLSFHLDLQGMMEKALSLDNTLWALWYSIWKKSTLPSNRYSTRNQITCINTMHLPLVKLFWFPLSIDLKGTMILFKTKTVNIMFNT